MYRLTLQLAGRRKTVLAPTGWQEQPSTTTWPTRTTSRKPICSCTTSIGRLGRLKSCYDRGSRSGDRHELLAGRRCVSPGGSRLYSRPLWRGALLKGFPQRETDIENPHHRTVRNKTSDHPGWHASCWLCRNSRRRVACRRARHHYGSHAADTRRDKLGWVVVNQPLARLHHSC